MANLLSLPDELLVAIGAHIDGRHRNHELLSLALVGPRLREIAREHLLCWPSFNLRNVHLYLWELGHHSHFVPRIRRLEIFSSNENRIKLNGRDEVVYPAIPCPPTIAKEVEFRSKCEDVIRFYNGTSTHTDTWLANWDVDVVPSLLGVLLFILPNLKELYIGAAWLMDFPMFSAILTKSADRLDPMSWHHPHLVGLAETLMPKLEVLDFPADLEGFWFNRRTRAICDFTRFRKLRCLGISWEALFWTPHQRMQPVDPSTILPSALRILRISECGGGTANFANEICLAKKKGRLPNLERVELYYKKNRFIVEAQSIIYLTPHPVHDIRQMFANAGLELYLYCPTFAMSTREIGGTPWSFAEEGPGILHAREEHVFMNAMTDRMGQPGYFELRLDVEGDVEMTL